VIFFAAAVMNVRRPECEEAPSNPDLSESGAKPHRKRITAVAGSALAIDDGQEGPHPVTPDGFQAHQRGS